MSTPPVHGPKRSEISLAGVIAMILRRWRLAVALPLTVALVAVASASIGRGHAADSSFTPEAGSGQTAPLAGFAAQFGIEIGGPDATISVDFYRALLESRQLLTDLARSELRFTSGDGEQRQGVLLDLLDVDGAGENERAQRAYRRLLNDVDISIDRAANLVRVRTRAESPELAETMNRRLLDLVDAFNIDQRSSSARARRDFAGQRVAEARGELQQAEEQLRTFLEQNRRFEDSPALVFEERRLQQEVDLREGIYTTLAQAYEQARVDAVRDIPLITIVEAPEGSARRAGSLGSTLILGLLFGGILALGVIGVAEYLDAERELDPRAYAELTEAWRSNPRTVDRVGRKGRQGAVTGGRPSAGTIGRPPAGTVERPRAVIDAPGAHFLTPADGRWRSALEPVAHDVYHLPEYAAIEAARLGGEARLFHHEVAGHRFLVPLVIRPVPDLEMAREGWSDAISPYGYASPLCDTEDPDLLERFVAELLERCRENRIASVFLRLHPLLPMTYEALAHHGAVVSRTRTVFVDVSVSGSTGWTKLRRNHRRDIRKLRLGGFRVHLDDWSRYAEFGAMYQEAMNRLEAHKDYDLSVSYFEALRRDLAGHVHFATVTTKDDELAAGGLFLRRGGLIGYHLCASAVQWLESPIKLMLHDVIRWAEATGATRVHLGGGVGGREDSVFNSKLGWWGNTADYHTVGLVTDPEACASLMARWRGHQAGSSPTPSFFPPYRAVPERAAAVGTG